MRRGGTWVQRWRVPLGFAVSLVFFVFARPTIASLMAGSAIALAGLAIRAWASGHIRKNDRLATSGPYAHTRNPLYFGSMVIGLGFSIAANRLWLGLLFVALFLGIYVPVMRVEASALAEKFREDFRRYEQTVPLLLPRLRSYRQDGAEPARFDSQLYFRYREYRAALGLAGALLVLVARAYFLK